MAKDNQTPAADTDQTREAVEGVMAGVSRFFKNIADRISPRQTPLRKAAGAVEDGLGKVGEAAGFDVSEAQQRVRQTARQLDDRLEESGINEEIGKFAAKLDKKQLTQTGLMAGGGVLAADGIRRMAQKDENGKRHVVKGAIETAAGVGAISAGVIARRNGQNGPDQGGQSL